MQESLNFDNTLFDGSQLLHSIANLRLYHNVQKSLYYEATISKKTKTKKQREAICPKAPVGHQSKTKGLKKH